MDISLGYRYNHSGRIDSQTEIPKSRKWTYIGLGTTGCLGLTTLMLMGDTSKLNLEDQDQKRLEDPLNQLQSDYLIARTAHLSSRSTAELLRSYFTFFMCEIPALVDYGPKALESYMAACEAIPVIGHLGWLIAATVSDRSLFHDMFFLVAELVDNFYDS